MLTTKIRITVAVLAAAFGVTFATFSVASVVGPVAPAHAADDEDGGPLDEDECEDLERSYNRAVQAASDAHAAGNWQWWDYTLDIVADFYLMAQDGGCEWAAEAAPPTSTGGIPDYATRDLSSYDQVLQSDEYRAEVRAAATLANKAELIDPSAEFTEPAWAQAR